MATTTKRQGYRATRRSLCPVCEEGIRVGMPVVYVPTQGRFHNYNRAQATVAIHAICERLHDLAALNGR